MNGEQLQTLENGRPKPILWIRMATRPFMTSSPGILGHSPWPIRGMRCSDFPRHNNNFITALRAKTQAHWAFLSFLDLSIFVNQIADQASNPIHAVGDLRYALDSGNTREASSV